YPRAWALPGSGDVAVAPESRPAWVLSLVPQSSAALVPTRVLESAPPPSRPIRGRALRGPPRRLAYGFWRAGGSVALDLLKDDHQVEGAVGGASLGTADVVRNPAPSPGRTLASRSRA